MMDTISSLTRMLMLLAASPLATRHAADAPARKPTILGLVAEKFVTMQDSIATIAQAMGKNLNDFEQSPPGRSFTVTDNGMPEPGLFG